MVEEVDSFKFGFQTSFLFVGDVLERRAIWTEVEADKLHNALAADDVSAEVEDDIDDILSVVLQLASLLQITGLPSIDDAYEATAVVVRRCRPVHRPWQDTGGWSHPDHGACQTYRPCSDGSDCTHRDSRRYI